jgi:hypothetical protein
MGAMGSQQHTGGVLLVSRPSARALLVVPVPVPMLVPVVLLTPLVCDSTNRAENTSLPIYGSVQKYTSDTNHEPRSIFHLIERMCVLWICTVQYRGQFY